MASLLTVLSVLVALAVPATIAQADCTWSINGDLPEFQPLYIKPGGSLDIFGFWLPQSGDVVTVPFGGQVLFACTGNSLPALGASEAILTCAGGKNWQDINGNIFTFSQLACVSNPFHTARDTGEICDIDGPFSLIQVGFLLQDNSFYVLLEHCLHRDLSDSIYSVFLQTPEILGHQSGFPRPGFVQGSDFYPSDMSVNTLYTFNSQIVAVEEAVGSAALAASYVQNGTDFYLARGHLSAKADFIYGSHQRATFWFMNVAPQWQTFNGGNWATLEYDSRIYSETYPNNIFVYTGTHGVTTLADVNNNQVPIYLYKDEFGSGIIKVPAIFWKVMFDPTTGLGVAFVGLNNPYVNNPGPEFFLCPDVCDQLNWLTWAPNDQVKGYSYCCEVPALAAAVPEIPPLPVTGLLT